MQGDVSSRLPRNGLRFATVLRNLGCRRFGGATDHREPVISKRGISCGLFGLWFVLCVQTSHAATIAVGPYTPSSTSPFVVPIEIFGAVRLDAFTFDLSFNPANLMINTACDPFSGDVHCDLLTGPVTQGSFYTNSAMFPPLFVPGFILLDGAGRQTGQLIAVNGAWQDPEPSPSGDGILAFVEFIAVAGGDPGSLITVVGPPSSTTVPEPTPLALMAVGLLAVMVQARDASGRRRVVA